MPYNGIHKRTDKIFVKRSKVKVTAAPNTTKSH